MGLLICQYVVSSLTQGLEGCGGVIHGSYGANVSEYDTRASSAIEDLTRVRSKLALRSSIWNIISNWIEMVSLYSHGS